METLDRDDRDANAPWYTSLWVLLVMILGLALLVAWMTARRPPAGGPQLVVVAPGAVPGPGEWAPGTGGEGRPERGRSPSGRTAPENRDSRAKEPPVSYV